MRNIISSNTMIEKLQSLVNKGYEVFMAINYNFQNDLNVKEGRYLDEQLRENNEYMRITKEVLNYFDRLTKENNKYNFTIEEDESENLDEFKINVLERTSVGTASGSFYMKVTFLNKKECNKFLEELGLPKQYDTVAREIIEDYPHDSVNTKEKLLEQMRWEYAHVFKQKLREKEDYIENYGVDEITELLTNVAKKEYCDIWEDFKIDAKREANKIRYTVSNRYLGDLLKFSVREITTYELDIEED